MVFHVMEQPLSLIHIFSVAIGELADGLKIDLDKVPKKYAGLDGTEIAISESQERMAVVVDPKDVEQFLSYAKEENLEAIPVAVVTKSPRLVMSWRGKTIVAVSYTHLISWPKYARVARSQTLAQKETVYIKAARLSGCGTGKIILKHILPNIFGPILVTAVLDIGTMMMELAGLSFLGLGAKPPIAEWGSMMSDTRNLLTTHPWVTLAPGFAIFVSVVIFNLLGDTVRDWLDPRNGR